MKKISVKTLCLIFVLTVLLTSVFALNVHADEDDYVKWTISGDNTQISNGEKMFYLYSTYESFYLDPDTVYVFENEVDFTLDGDDDGNTVYSVSTDAEFIWIEDDYMNTYVYVTNEGKKQLDVFLAGAPYGFRMQDTDGDFTDFGKDKVEQMDALAASGESSETVNVVALASVPSYELIARDETNAFAYVYGALYLIDDGVYCYINYLTLGNNYFDANGNFSYRNGTVTVTVLDDGLCDYVDEAVDDIDYFYPKYVYESDGFDDGDKVVFWFAFVLFGFLAPIPFLVIGLTFPHSQKKGCPKHWYALAAIAAVWLLAALLLAVVMLI